MPHLIAGLAILDPGDVVRRADTVCARLIEHGAFEEALSWAETTMRGLDADQRTQPSATGRMRLRVAECWALLGDRPEAKRQLIAATNDGIAADDALLIADAALWRAGIDTTRASDRETLDLLEEAQRRIGPDNLATIARLRAARGTHLVHSEGRGAEGRATLSTALEMARRSGDKVALADVLGGRANALMASNRVRERGELLDEIVEIIPSLNYRDAVRSEEAVHHEGMVLALQVADRHDYERHHDWWRSNRRPGSRTRGALTTMWEGLRCLLDGDPDRAREHALELFAVEDADYDIYVSGGGQMFAAHRWRGTLDAVVPGIVQFADAPDLASLGRANAAIAMALVGDQEAAMRYLDGVLDQTTLLTDDSTLAGQCAALVEACVLTGRSIPAAVEPVLQSFTGQLLVVAWGIDVPGSADRYLGIIRTLEGDRDRALEHFDAAESLERRMSEAIALRGRVWRHVLVGDVPLPAIPPSLRGLEVERTALVRAVQLI
jgi:tetratricopeptide (TPR) repeat protein